MLRRRKSKKKGGVESVSKIDRYVTMADYYLNLLEKRIKVYKQRLERLEKIKKKVAMKGNKELLVEVLRTERILKTKLKNYLGMHQSLQQVVGRIQDVEIIKGMTELFKEGGAILKELSREVSPEAAEEAKIEIEDTIAEISEAESVLGEPIRVDEVEEEDLEAEAEKLIAEAKLPDVKEAEDVDLEEIEKELKDLMLEEEK